MYWDAFSQEQRYHALCKQLCKLISYADQLGIDTEYLGDLYTQLANDFEAFKEHGFDDYYKALIEKWIDKNMRSIIERAIKMVFFGLTEDGYFCAYIPKSWQGILFNTIADYASENYGCLVLSY